MHIYIFIFSHLKKNIYLSRQLAELFTSVLKTKKP